jgi:hypothetical protein
MSSSKQTIIECFSSRHDNSNHSSAIDEGRCNNIAQMMIPNGNTHAHNVVTVATIEPRLLIHPSSIPHAKTECAIHGRTRFEPCSCLGHGYGRMNLNEMFSSANIRQQLEWQRVFQYWPTPLLDIITSYAVIDIIIVIGLKGECTRIWTMYMDYIYPYENNDSTNCSAQWVECKLPWSLEFNETDINSTNRAGIINGNLTIIDRMSHLPFT